MNKTKMSKKALEILQALFSENSNLQLPVAVFEQVIEIRTWIEEEIKKIDTDA